MSFVISSNIFVTQTLGTGANGFVTATGTLYTEAATAVSVTGASSLAVMGTVATATGVAAVRTSGTVASFDMTVGAAGSVFSTGTDAIRLSVAGDVQLTNNGMIAGGTGLYLTGNATQGEASIVNNGTITANSSDSISSTLGAIVIDTGVDDTKILNSGRIQAAYNVPSFAFAIELNSSALTVIVNSGEIVGTFGSINTQGNLSLTNSGTISGRVRYAEDLWVENTGTIIGNISSIDSSSNSSASVTNRGLIDGSVQLGNGGGFFYNFGGFVTGSVQGGLGDDSFYIDRANIRIEASTGIDTIYSSVDYRLSVGASVERLFADGDQGVRLTGNRQGNEIRGDDGDDTLYGRGGDDTLSCGDGDDSAFGGAGNDTFELGSGDDTLNGGDGTDTLALAFLNAVQIDLTAGTATGFASTGIVLGVSVVQGIENVVTSQGNDTVTGSAEANLLDGQFGNDSIRGMSGDDTLQGVTGNDTLDGGLGNDAVFGGAGLDSLLGSNGNDTLEGADGNDTLNGGSNDDRIDGGANEDSLLGSFGADTLIGGTGRDTMDGGAGADVFVFRTVAESTVAARDIIRNFETAVDVIDLSEIYADLNAPVDTAFVFRGAGAFSGTDAQVNYIRDNALGITTVQLRLADSTSNDSVFVLQGTYDLTAANFIL